MSLSLFRDPLMRDPFMDTEFGLAPFGMGGMEQWNTRNNMLGSCDIVETKDAHIFTLDTPGMSKDDVKIECENDILTISGERKSQYEQKDDKVHRVERRYGTFQRSFRLPEGVDPQSISARFNNGTLRVEVPKPAGSKRAKVHKVAISQ
eukprot:m.253892 g.253892  ORF g.253892 m.253892 type:complete len:149 (-) comp17519_c0_seq1:263-709(-)